MKFREALMKYDKDYWDLISSSKRFPEIEEIRAKITKIWRLVEGDNYIWVDGNNEKSAMERYIKCLDVITKKARNDVPHGLLKMIARVFVRYRLDPDLLDGFETKEGWGHAAYNRIRNSMRFVPEYYRRFGVLRLGGVLVPEFHKTIVHEYGHMLWHNWLNDAEKKRWFGIIPQYQKTNKETSGWIRPFVTSTDGHRADSSFLIPVDTPFISLQEIMSPTENFAEDFTIYTIAPDKLREMFPDRYKFMEDIIDTDHRILSQKELQKVNVDDEGKRHRVSDFIAVDLQTTDKRIRLANLFEQKLMVLLTEKQIPIEKVMAITPIGDYSSPKPDPEFLEVYVYCPALQPSVKGSPFIYNDPDVRIRIYDNEQDCNKAIFDKLGLAMDQIERQGEDIVKKERLAPHEIERWVTIRGKRVPIPKHRPHRSLIGRPQTLPLGHAAPKPKVGTLKLQRPLQTKYVIQEHLAERAGKHYDLRIKIGDRAYSWALPKGLPKRGEKRLAILQPPHTTAYMAFQGRIKGGYGKGQVRITDGGNIEITRWDENRRAFRILGGPKVGTYVMLRRERNNWLVLPVRRKPVPEQYKLKDYRMKFKKFMLRGRNYAAIGRRGGPRVLIYCGSKGNRILTRTAGVKGKGFVERTDNYPHIRDAEIGNDGTVYEGEMFVHSPEVSNGIVISLPDRARAIQAKSGPATFYANDLLAVEGDDSRRLKYGQRLRLLRKILPVMKTVKKAPVKISNKKRILGMMFDAGYHGAYIVDLDAPYDNVAGVYITGRTVEKANYADDIRKFWVDPKEIIGWYTSKTGKRIPLTRKGKLIGTRKPISEKKQYEPYSRYLKFKDEMWKDPKYVLQPKLDGSRYLLYVGKNQNRLLSRKVSVKEGVGHVERTDNVPDIRDMKFPFSDTVLDGEMIRTDFATTQRIMGSSPGKSLALQDKLGRPIYIVFDVIRFRGKDVKGLPYEERIKLLEDNIPQNEAIKVMPTFEGNKRKMYDQLIRMGYEGIVMKDKTKGYEETFSTKKKKVKTDDFIVIGYTEGKGRNKGKIGAIQIGKWNPETQSVVYRGKVGTGLSDQARIWWTANKDRMINKVIEVKFMELTAKKIPRAPVLMRVREDKDASQTI